MSTVRLDDGVASRGAVIGRRLAADDAGERRENTETEENTDTTEHGVTTATHMPAFFGLEGRKSRQIEWIRGHPPRGGRSTSMDQPRAMWSNSIRKAPL